MIYTFVLNKQETVDITQYWAVLYELFLDTRVYSIEIELNIYPSNTTSLCWKQGKCVLPVIWLEILCRHAVQSPAVQQYIRPSSQVQLRTC